MHTLLKMFFGLGPALRRLRERGAGMTQLQVAERTGISQGRLSSYERGRKVPDLTTLDRLLTCYGVDLEGLNRALREEQGAAPPAADEPQLKARIRAALVELGYWKRPPSEPET